MKRLITQNEFETENAGAVFGKALDGGAVVFLEGDLGVGKTVFVRGIAKALGIKDEVLSPTFALMNEYKGDKFNLCHIDAYRLKNNREAQGSGILEKLELKDTVTVIEWAKNIAPLYLKNTAYAVTITLIDESTREITVQ